MEEQNENRKLTNAELELQADAAGAGEVKRISYAGLIARRFFRQKSAIAGLIVLAVMVLIAVVGPMVCPYDYTEPDFAAINVPPRARTGPLARDRHLLRAFDHDHRRGHRHGHRVRPRMGREDRHVDT